MAHSKRNTSLPHFTSYERSLLRSSWGTKQGVIGRDSFLPFGACRLCLQPARPPVVACATNGDLFCRECAISDLLAQRQEIKRLEREREEARKRIAEGEERALEEARMRELREFELISMGLQTDTNGERHGKRKAEETDALAAFKMQEIEADGKRRKVSELDEKEIARFTKREQERLKEELKRDKSDYSSPVLHSFWVPSLTPGTDPDEVTANRAIKPTPICPASTEANRHSYSLKSLVDVHFTEEKASDGTVSRVCPSCKKNLTNGLRAMLTKPCGHIICAPCVSKFMTPCDAPDPHASRGEKEHASEMRGLIICYVCETDITPRDPQTDTATGKKSKKNHKDSRITPGLVEVCSEGTGFSERGGNVATKRGVAFQC